MTTGTAERGERRRCPTCPRLRLPRYHLCRWCLGRLPLRARIALWRRDEHAAARSAGLARQIRDGVPLDRIRIPA